MRRIAGCHQSACLQPRRCAGRLPLPALPETVPPRPGAPTDSRSPCEGRDVTRRRSLIRSGLCSAVIALSLPEVSGHPTVIFSQLFTSIIPLGAKPAETSRGSHRFSVRLLLLSGRDWPRDSLIRSFVFARALLFPVISTISRQAYILFSLNSSRILQTSKIQPPPVYHPWCKPDLFFSELYCLPKDSAALCACVHTQPRQAELPVCQRVRCLDSSGTCVALAKDLLSVEDTVLLC